MLRRGGVSVHGLLYFTLKPFAFPPANIPPMYGVDTHEMIVATHASGSAQTTWTPATTFAASPMRHARGPVMHVARAMDGILVTLVRGLASRDRGL